MMKTDKSFTEDKDFIFIDKFKDPVLVEFKEGQIHRVRPYKESLLGNIYLGRVDHRVPQLKAYFLDLGQGKRGFLQEDLDLAKGDLVLVQVAKDAYSKKYPGLKTDLSIPGDRLVYFPQGKKLYYSLKNKKALKKIWQKAKNDLPPGGWLIRTKAQDPKRDLEEAKDLYQLWQKFLQEERLSPKAKCLYRKDQVPEGQRVYTNDPDLARERGWIHVEDSLYHMEDYRKDLEELNKVQVPLEGGGLIRIEKTAALTSIDVDSSQGPDQGLTPEEINILAAKKASQQILRRDLRGMLVIDFITCDQDKKKDLEKILEEAFRDDPQAILYGFSPMGLYELVRKRKEK